MINKTKRSKNSLFNYLDILITLGKMGGGRRLVTCTTSELGDSIGISQQSTSRKLVEMENTNLIVRNYSQRGNSIKITPEGIANMEQVFTDLWMILTTSGQTVSEKIILRGKVITGMAEGAYYIGQQAYQDQFSMILDLCRIYHVNDGDILINDEKIPAAIVRPERTHHSNQIELISPDNIKKKYGVKDGDELEIILA